MTYENFIEAIKAEVAELCPNDKILTEKITKNNSVILDALVIFGENTCASPNIYLKNYYEEFERGKDIKEIAKEIVNFSNKYKNAIELNFEDYKTFEGVKNKILCRLVNYEQNEELLAKCPHRRFLDLALIYYCVEMDCNNEFGSWTISDIFCKEWKVTEEILYETALDNLHRLMPLEIIDIWDLLEMMTGEKYVPEDEEELEMMREHRMYVLTNERKIFGATSILFEDYIKAFGREYGSFFILPSSIHEVILVPVEDTSDAQRYKNMVCDVNKTMVSKIEYLSDEVYFFDAVEQEIRRLII